MERSDEHWDAVERLWRTLKRDLLASVEEFAGFREAVKGDDTHVLPRTARFERNWTRLCELDIDVAERIYHGLEEVSSLAGRLGMPNSPSEHSLRLAQEITGLAQLGRSANPDVDVRTLGELVELGEAALRREVDALEQGISPPNDEPD